MLSYCYHSGMVLTLTFRARHSAIVTMLLFPFCNTNTRNCIFTRSKPKTLFKDYVAKTFPKQKLNVIEIIYWTGPNTHGLPEKGLM